MFTSKIYLGLFMHGGLSLESYVDCLISFLQMSILCGWYYYETHSTFAEMRSEGEASALSYELRKRLALFGTP